MSICGFLFLFFLILFIVSLCLLRECLDVPRIAIGFGHSGTMADSFPEESFSNQLRQLA